MPTVLDLSQDTPETEEEVQKPDKPVGPFLDEDGALILEDTDGRGLWVATSRYEPQFRRSQAREACYLFVLLLVAVVLLVAYPLRLLPVGLAEIDTQTLRTYFLLCIGGLLGGTVYGAKWLYHAVAKGLWHQDRRVWRYLSPWISLGTTLGVGSLFLAGFFRALETESGAISGSKLLGLGFIIGYFSDKALAKMRDVTEVIFGETRSRPAVSRRSEEN